jgi:hypothetical protein
MDARKEIPPQLFAAVIVVVVLIVGYFLWSRVATPEPTIPPGQDLQHPFGHTNPGGPGNRQGGPPQVPAPGTVGPNGFGPSKGAPIPR